MWHHLHENESNMIFPSGSYFKQNNSDLVFQTCTFFSKEQYPVTVHAPNFDFWTGCPEIKRCEESKRTLKNPFSSCLAEFDTTLKLLRITDQWYIVPVEFWFGRNWDFMALLLLPLARGPKVRKCFYPDWRLISSASKSGKYYWTWNNIDLWHKFHIR